MESGQRDWQKLTRQRWWVLAASCLINMCIGSMYAWSVFSAPLAEKFSALGNTGVTAGSLAVVFTVGNSVGPVTLISGGMFNDKMGPKWVIFLGGLMFGGGMLLCSAAARSSSSTVPTSASSAPAPWVMADQGRSPS